MDQAPARLRQAAISRLAYEAMRKIEASLAARLQQAPPLKRVDPLDQLHFGQIHRGAEQLRLEIARGGRGENDQLPFGIVESGDPVGDQRLQISTRSFRAPAIGLRQFGKKKRIAAALLLRGRYI